MWPNPEFPADLVAFTEKILYGKLNFLCSVVLFMGGLKEGYFQSFGDTEDETLHNKWSFPLRIS